jgi:UDP-3-O-[3-hydroxymyristoyl] glucosamine N-acyltransferase
VEAFTTGRLAERVGGVCEGSPDVALTALASLDHAGPGDLSFCRGGKWAKALAHTRASAVLVSPGLDAPEGVVAIRVADPRLAWALAAEALSPTAWPPPGRHPTAWVAADAIVGDGVTIDAFAVVDAGARVGSGSWIQHHASVGRGAVLGERCRLMPGAVVMERSRLGDRVWLHPGAVIGADGFGHVRGREGIARVPHLGVAVLEDDVEVGANTCVDRAALGETRVGRGTRLDNLVQVAHGVRVGAECLVAAFAGIAGGARIGDGVVMAGRSAVVDGIEVGSGAVFAGLASASRDVPENARIGGSPARAYGRWLREVASIARLPSALKLLARIDERLASLEQRSR